MKFMNVKWLIALAFLYTVNGQATVTTTTTAAATTTTTVAPTTTTTVAPTTTTTTLSTLAPATSSVIVTSANVTTTTTTIAPVSTTSSIIPTSLSSLISTSASSTVATSSSPVPSASETPKKDGDNNNNTAIIVGCVVGGVVGIALIGGIIACINRRGGCTKKRDKGKSEFEDYGLGDFPHHRPAVVAAPMAKPISPTIPRLNDQGNYYADDGYGGHYQGGYVDNNMDYGMQQQQGYYYPDQQQQYYDDGGYYYDSNTSATYSNAPPMQQHSPAMHAAGVAPMQQQPYVPPHQTNIYKPDEVGAPGGNNVKRATQ